MQAQTARPVAATTDQNARLYAQDGIGTVSQPKKPVPVSTQTLHDGSEWNER